MSERYETYRGAKNRKRLLIFPEGGFAALPNQARHAGPWTDGTTGEVARLKPEIRLELARQGWVLIEDAGIGFRWEV